MISHLSIFLVQGLHKVFAATHSAGRCLWMQNGKIPLIMTCVPATFQGHLSRCMHVALVRHPIVAAEELSYAEASILSSIRRLSCHYLFSDYGARISNLQGIVSRLCRCGRRSRLHLIHSADKKRGRSPLLTALSRYRSDRIGYLNLMTRRATTIV